MICANFYRVKGGVAASFCHNPPLSIRDEAHVAVEAFLPIDYAPDFITFFRHQIAVIENQ